MSIAAVVLAAGASTRLGRPKQTLEIDGETLVERAARIAQEAGCKPVIVVINPQADFGHSLQQRGCVVVINETAGEGIASSIRRGVNVARMLQATGAILMTCDQPRVRPKHLRALIADPTAITGSEYVGHIGVPAHFPSTSFDALINLQGDEGARDLLRNANSILDETLALDIDTEEDFSKAQTPP
jgi:molybdenum cofactor cytidylyltransferase